MKTYSRSDLWFDLATIAVSVLLVALSFAGCSGGQIALVVDSDGNMKQVTCVEYKQPGAKAELLCQ
jgi:hypothetical protein